MESPPQDFIMKEMQAGQSFKHFAKHLASPPSVRWVHDLLGPKVKPHPFSMELMEVTPEVTIRQKRTAELAHDPNRFSGQGAPSGMAKSWSAMFK